MKAIALKRTEVIIGGLQFQMLPFLVPFEMLVAVAMDRLYKKQVSVKENAVKFG